MERMGNLGRNIMPAKYPMSHLGLLLVAGLLVLPNLGCRTWAGLRPVPARAVGAEPRFVPGEKNMVSLPTYTVEPPDILLIDAVRIVPKAPFHIQPFDVMSVEVRNIGVGD